MAKTEYVNRTARVVYKKPILVSVSFKRHLNGFPVVGPGGEISISLGNNGKLLDLTKIWRKLEYVGDVQIISAKEAFEKLKRGEVVNKPMRPLEVLTQR